MSGFAIVSPPPPAGATATEDVRRGLPTVNDGKVMDIEQVGDWVIVGGTFTEVTLADGTVLPQKYLFGYNAITGAYADHFQPVLDDAVLALEPKGDDRNIFVGGAFGEADGRRRKKMAMYNVNTGNISTQFIGNINSQVATIAVSDQHVYIGGNFESGQQQIRSGLARLDIETGAIDPTFDFGTTEDAGRPISFPPDINGVPQPPIRQGGVVTVDVTPDNTKLVVVHRGLKLGGQDRPGIGIIDITNGGGTLTSFVAATPDLTEPIYSIERCADQGIRVTDMEISPDGTYFVVTHTGADGLLVCDQIHRYEITTGMTAPTWRTRAFDSVFAVGIDDDAIYVGGHFRYLPSPAAPSAYPGRTTDGLNRFNIYDADPTRDANFRTELVETGYVYRAEQIGAISPYTGKGLPTWDPTSNAFKGVLDLTTVPDGLLVGQDNDRVQGVLTGYAAEFRNGNFDNIALNKPVTSSPAQNGETAARAVDGSHNPNVSKFSSATGTDHFIDVDLGRSTTINRANIFGPAVDFDTNFADISVFVSETPFTSTTVAGTRAQAGVTEYNFPGERSSQIHLRDVVRSRYFRVASTAPQLDVAEIEIWGPSEQAKCVLRKLNPTTVEVSWTNANDSNVIVRRDGVFAGSSTGPDGSFQDSVAGGGTFTYLIRTNVNGAQTDVACGQIVLGTPALNCTATVNGSKVDLDWSTIGVNNYSVRRNGTFLATSALTMFTDASPGGGTVLYEVRANVNGTQITESCGTVNLTQASCTAAALGSDARIDWQNASGNTLVVRRNGAFLATVTGTTSFTDTNPEPGPNSYQLRIRANGNFTDIPCGSVAGSTPTCVATVSGSRIELSWTDIGANSYAIRRDGSFLASTNGTAFTDYNPPAGATDYLIRTNNNGDIPCGSVTVSPPLCIAIATPNGIELSWTDIGANSYSVRRNGTFLASTNGTSFIDHNPPAGTVSYLIRTGKGDINCGSIVN